MQWGLKNFYDNNVLIHTWDSYRVDLLNDRNPNEYFQPSIKPGA